MTDSPIECSLNTIRSSRLPHLQSPLAKAKMRHGKLYIEGNRHHAYAIRDMNLPSIPPYDAEQHVHVIVVSQDFIVANLITQPPVEYQPVADKPYKVKGLG